MRTIIPSQERQWSHWHHKLHHLVLDDPSLLPKGSSLLISVSGGQDSVALAKLLLDLKQQHEWKLKLWHGNHNWRSDATTNAEHVKNLAEEWGLPITIDTAIGLPRKEASARDWRYECLQKRAELENCPLVLTGHTASDRAETFLFNLIRGSDLRGLGSLKRKRILGGNISLVRPLLIFTREDTRRCCEQLGLDIWQDSTNNDKDLSRNMIRIEVIEKLKGVNAKTEVHISRTAELIAEMSDEQRAIEQLALKSLLVDFSSIRMNRELWHQQPRVVQKRLMWLWIEENCQEQLTDAATEEIWKKARVGARSKIIRINNSWSISLNRKMMELVKNNLES